MACTTSEASSIFARSTKCVPSPKTRRTAAATCSASRVLPTPPGPVSVSRRDSARARLTEAVSCRRPTNVVIGWGSVSPLDCLVLVIRPTCASPAERTPTMPATAAAARPRGEDGLPSPTVGRALQLDCGWGGARPVPDMDPLASATRWGPRSRWPATQHLDGDVETSADRLQTAGQWLARTHPRTALGRGHSHRRLFTPAPGRAAVP